MEIETTASKPLQAQTTEANPLSAFKTELEKYTGVLLASGEEPTNLYEQILNALQVPLLQTALEVTRGNQSKAARFLGLSRGSLRKYLKAHNLF